MCFCCAIAHTVFVSCSFFAKTQELVIDIPADNKGQPVDYWRVCVAGLGMERDGDLQSGGSLQSNASLQTVAAPQSNDSLQTAVVPQSNDSLQTVAPGFREYLIPAGGALLVDVPKNSAVSVLAYPQSNGDTSLGQEQKPWGTIYPWYRELQPQDGFAAHILYRLYSSADYTHQSAAQVQDYLSRFNWKKFVELCRTMPDLWLSDSDKVVQDIALGKFKKTDLSQ